MGEKINWCCPSVVAQQEGGAEEGLEGRAVGLWQRKVLP